MGTAIGTILISYDVDSRHKAVKDAMKELGYYDKWHYDPAKIYDLPNTTLWHDKKSTDQAITDLRRVCTNLSVKLERAVAVQATDFVGI